MQSKQTPDLGSKAPSDEQSTKSLDQNSQQQVQGFPFTRKDVLQMLKTPTQKGQRMYNQRDAEHMVKYALEDLNKYGYDFPYSSKRIYSKKCKKMRKQVYLQFRCEKCEQRFTSIVGTLQVKFIIKEIQDSRFLDPFLVQFNVRIYRMKCMKCNTFANPRIYDSQLEACQVGFCLIVDQILKEIPPPDKRNKGKRYLRQIHNHKVDYCQACIEGICIAKR